VYFRDVTERKNNELAIAEKETLLSSINKNIQEGIYRSIEGKGIVYTNEAFAKLFGFESPEEILGMHTRDLIADTNRRTELLAKAKAQGRYTNEKIELVRKDGTHFWGLVSAILIRQG
jgi:PAS domain S-box-containing protein